MPEDLTTRLTRFTPTGLDRDAVLFASGKAAGRKTAWKWLTAILAVSNAVTVTMLLWPRSVSPTPVVPPIGIEPDAIPLGSSSESSPPSPFSYTAMMHSFDWSEKPVTVEDGESPRSIPLTPRSHRDPRFN